jgi:beta-mannosidase
METVDLAGSWELRQSGEADSRLPGPVPIRIPGDNLSALLHAGLIPDPYYGSQELQVQWVGRSDWLLSRRFTIESGFLRDRKTFLHLEGVDTVAEVRVNGKLVAGGSNMFVPLRAELEDALREGENLIEVLLRSAENEASARSRALPYPLPHSRYPVQSPHRNLVRKAQCHSGWDWGPCLMPSGIYGPAFIGSCSVGRLEGVHTVQRFTPRGVELEVVVEFFAYRPAELPLEIETAGARSEGILKVSPGLNLHRQTLLVRDPELWWPAGYGAQALQALRVRAGEAALTKSIGFRRLEVRCQDDEAGRGLVFRVNGVDVFCKGANWIPCDALPARQTLERYEALLESAVQANMNMLRVWGGGQYERELFYELCDRKGLLVWQDFMFSCATYPASPSFLAEVEPEIRHQVRRLQDHPCLALWCGNNEDLGALTWFPETRAERDRYLVDYDRLNEGLVGRLVRELDPGRTWWPSSPSAGEGDYSDNWHDDRKGDMHYWSVWHEGQPFEAFYQVTPRFCSEFGFQSLPSLEAVRSFAPESQWNVTAPDVEHHQRHPRGNTVITETMTRYFRLPEGFDHFLYLSQVQQALAVKTAVEFWRSRRPACMGILYWQLDDCWPAASWSSIEYPARWKLLHYAARRFYAPVHVLAFLRDEKVEVFGINDTRAARRGDLDIRFLDFTGQARAEQLRTVTLGPESSTALGSFPLAGLPAAPEELFLHLRFRHGQETIENELFLCAPKRCELQEPHLKVRAKREQDGFEVELAAERPAFFLCLETRAASGHFSDALFTLLPGSPRTVRFSGQPGGLSEGSFEASLHARHLRGTYR